MSDSLQDIDLVERYFDNEMSEAERSEFLERMKTDLELRHLFDRERLLINIVRYNATKNNLEFLKDLDRSLPAISIEPKKSNWLYYAVAASVILLISIGIFIYNADNVSPEKLYASYFNPYPNVFEPTVRSNNSASTRAMAFQKYEEGDFAQAVTLFSELIREQREPGVLMLLGNAHLSVGNTQEAETIFKELAGESNELQTAAQWYLSLTYLKTGNHSSAKQTLQGLVTPENAYSKRAVEILSALE